MCYSEVREIFDSLFFDMGSMKREFPEHPIVGVGAVVIDGSRVLLVQRGQEPLKGEWSLPGGVVELGEGLAEAVCRAVKEETGPGLEPLAQIAAFERVVGDGAG